MKKYFVLILLFAVLNGCQESPTSVGGGILNSSDLLSVSLINSYDANFAQTTKNFQKKINLGAASRVLIGKYENLTSSGLIKYSFVLPDSVSLAVQNNKLSVLKSWMELPVTYRIGDISTLNFQLKKILSPWTSVGFNEDSLSGISLDNTNLISSSIHKTDSLISFSVQNDFGFEWIKNQVNEQRTLNRGVIFEPQSGTNAMVGFPALVSAISKDNLPKLYCQVSYDGKLDTVIAYSSTDLHVIKNNNSLSGDDKIVLQSGTGLRTNLWFDLSAIPVNAIISDAKLILYRDSVLTTTGSITSDSVFVNALFDSTTDSIYTGLNSRLLARKGNIYEGRIFDIVQYWLSSVSKNQGLQLRIVSEDSNINKLVFKGSSYSDAALRPRLVIFLSNIDN
ncbi:MAG: hypothetical protein CO129_08260 [Ignavibacteriales bacterium CG_4_9_14_3_um_filter_34_10]|nr:MAG: hypothetical protein CO129_08260 [Ignavibacteriales bacterium CG_4_9_14_3_um_filter_34_10]